MNISLRLFLRKNYKEVTMKEIVNETGLSKGAFYHYFESKEQLFHEIMEFFFSRILSFDFSTLPTDSLKDFYEAYSAQLNTLRSGILSQNEEEGEDFISLNFFTLLFEAFRLFPEFRKEMEEYHAKETRAWIDRIAAARARGEICSPLSDREIARIFLFTSDGLTLNLTMDQDTGDLDKQLASLWSNFYRTIQCS